MLVREALEVGDDIQVNDLYKDIHELFRIDAGTPADRAVAIFEQLNIKPFTRKSVENYMWWKAAFKNDFAPVGAVISVIGFVLGLGLGINWLVRAEFGFLALGIILGSAILLAWTIWYTEMKDWTWTTADLSTYARSRPVPEYVWQTAVDIKKLCPAADMQVEYLLGNKDPFLFVIIDGDRHYVEVWNEPKFHAKRSI